MVVSKDYAEDINMTGDTFSLYHMEINLQVGTGEISSDEGDRRRQVVEEARELAYLYPS